MENAEKEKNIEIVGSLGIAQELIDKGLLKTVNGWMGVSNPGGRIYPYKELIIPYLEWASRHLQNLLIVEATYLETLNQDAAKIDIIEGTKNIKNLKDKSNKAKSQIRAVIEEHGWKNISVTDFNSIMSHMIFRDHDRYDFIKQKLTAAQNNLDQVFKIELDHVVKEVQNWKAAAFPEIEKYKQPINKQKATLQAHYGFEEIRLSILLAEILGYQIKIGPPSEICYDHITAKIFDPSLATICGFEENSFSFISGFRNHFGAIYLTSPLNQA